MDKSQKYREFDARTQRLAHSVAAIFIFALAALAAAFYAASAAQANALFPDSGELPAIPAIYPEFDIAPRSPHLQLTAERVHSGQQSGSTWFRGVASWYGPSFNGHLTANGEVYDMYAMTAATSESHSRLPLGTKVRVVNSHNGRSVVLRITDRGPLPRGRILDLSYGAARKLAMVKPGIAHVRVQVLHWGNDSYHSPSRG